MRSFPQSGSVRPLFFFWHGCGVNKKEFPGTPANRTTDKGRNNQKKNKKLLASRQNLNRMNFFFNHSKIPKKNISQTTGRTLQAISNVLLFWCIARNKGKIKQYFSNISGAKPHLNANQALFTLNEAIYGKTCCVRDKLKQSVTRTQNKENGSARGS